MQLYQGYRFIPHPFVFPGIEVDFIFIVVNKCEVIDYDILYLMCKKIKINVISFQ